MVRAHALWVVGVGECEIREEDLSSKLGAEEIRVRTLWSGISRGTENIVVRGGVPQSERERMRGPNMDGDFCFPVKYGYSSVGIVEAVGSKVKALSPGKKVFALYPHQDVYQIAADQVIELPAEAVEDRAVLAPNMETALNVIWDAGVSPGDRVCIVGGGVIGLLIAFLCGRIPGCEVKLKDPQVREIQCQALGIQSFKNENNFDLVIHASGNPEALSDCLLLAGDEAVIVEASWYGNKSCLLPLGQDFHVRRLTIKSSQVGNLPPQKRPRWTHRRRLALALSLCASPENTALNCLLEPPLKFDHPNFTQQYLQIFSLNEQSQSYSESLPSPPTLRKTGLCYRIKYPPLASTLE